MYPAGAAVDQNLQRFLAGAWFSRHLARTVESPLARRRCVAFSSGVNECVGFSAVSY
jgi:hypothetical protein